MPVSEERRMLARKLEKEIIELMTKIFPTPLPLPEIVRLMRLEDTKYKYFDLKIVTHQLYETKLIKVVPGGYIIAEPPKFRSLDSEWNY